MLFAETCEPKVFSGPDPGAFNRVPKKSMGKIIYDRLKEWKDASRILNINAVTAEVLTSKNLLESSVRHVAIFKNLGLRTNDVVAIISENTTHYIVPVLAGFYMGVIVNPFNPDYSRDELIHALAISQPKIILCSQRSLNMVLQLETAAKVFLMGTRGNSNPEIKSVENLPALQTLHPFEPKDFDSSDQTALILFSSGTTGLPKGVQITHENLRVTLDYFCQPNFANVTDQDITVSPLPFFHIMGLFLQIVGMVTSMTTVVFDRFKPELYLKCIEQYKATKLFLVPPILQFLAASPLVDNYNLESLKYVQVGGSNSDKRTQDQLMKRLNVVVKQGYGLSETTAITLYQTMDSSNYEGVGSLVPGAVAKVENPITRKSLGALEIGELCFKGPMVMKGYIPDQCHLDDEGFFHSGDVGFYDQSGNFSIVGRIKEIIKYKGFQVPPTELESLILKHPKVLDCGVIGIPNERAGELPMAFVVLKNDAIVNGIEIEDFVAERISIQKRLHGGVRFIQQIPRTVSGKILRQELLKIFYSFK